MRTLRTMAATGLLISMTVACDTSDSPSGDDNAPSVSPEEIGLPPVPSLDLLDVPEEYADGSRSVIGTLDNRAEFFGQELDVSGVVQSFYICDVEAHDDEGNLIPEEQRPGCKTAHLFIGDTSDSPRTFRVTGYSTEDRDTLVEGLRYTFTGHYLRSARGLASSTGVLVTTEISGPGFDAAPADGEIQ